MSLKTDEAKRRREELIKKEVEEIRARIDKAKPMPTLAVPFCPATPLCQSPTVRGLQCKRPAGRKPSTVRHLVNGKNVLVQHETCWQHIVHQRLK